MAKKKKNKKNKKLSWDKISFEKREKLRAELKKERVITKAFRQKQSFGGAGPVIHIDLNEYIKEHPEYKVYEK